ncbi:MAG: hypothetical protein OEW52_10120 [Thermoleophilia bacterium]|nr:hypothetical protein [Thermoleophilia bacterium]MDH4339988.1 hypothetical protein [Thermoleophilia bacterium]MDH5281486.1 hypothetical protein [Thermoleophilia bacterium]
MTRSGQGEALVAWAVWGVMTLAVLVTYSRIDPNDTYNVSREGLAGGLSRSVTLLNFPIALVAIALALLAVAALPRRAWWAAAPAIALCATIPWFVDQGDLDARWSNAIPALGVLIAVALTATATSRAGASYARRLPGDRLRVIAAVVVLLMSLPWVTAELGFHFPGGVFMGEELAREGGGRDIAAVHLGHHHGTDGALLVVTALLLSRMRVPEGRLRIAVTAYLGTMLAYGAVNGGQDFWHEQVVKRGWTDAGIPSALLPGARPIWLVVLALAALATMALLRETKSASYSAA